MSHNSWVIMHSVNIWTKATPSPPLNHHLRGSRPTVPHLILNVNRLLDQVKFSDSSISLMSRSGSIFFAPNRRQSTTPVWYHTGTQLNLWKTDTTPILAGWDLEHTCGSLPSNANTVKLFAGNQYEKDFIQFEVPSDGGSETKSGITISRSGDNLKFTGIEVSLLVKSTLNVLLFFG